jgi:hypothetical protein
VIYPVSPSEKIYVAITNNVSPPDDPRALKSSRPVGRWRLPWLEMPAEDGQFSKSRNAVGKKDHVFAARVQEGLVCQSL